jgi:hypothetical protein
MRAMMRLVAAVIAAVPITLWTAPAPDLTLDLRDYVEFPITGRVDGKGQTDGLLARINSLREEPGGANRFFVNDLNGPLYIVDKATKRITTFLDFRQLFPRFSYQIGYANGLNTLQFDPDYQRNGKFYTVHIEDPSLPDRPVSIAGYRVTAPIPTPGPIQREGVLIEWTDTNRSNATFEGTARELMRIPTNTRIHTLADVVFNPAAKRGDPEWRVLYIGSGDGGSGEAKSSIRMNPQRLDTLVGKVLRIVPDLDEHPSTSTVSENGRYRVPNDNPFVSVAGARPEIWAYGFRNPARLHFAIDDNPANSRLIANSIGLHTWETVNIVRKGENYGYSEREGNETLLPDNHTAKLPADDRIPVRVTDTITRDAVPPTYPVIQYGHVKGGGDAIGSGVLYRGRLIAALRGKYVFTDISTGRIWWADYREMLAADDGKPETMAAMHAIKLRWNGQVYDSMFAIAEAAYRARGGQSEHLPGLALVSGAGRADAHVGVDAAGELYILTKSDGVLRLVTSGGT